MNRSSSRQSMFLMEIIIAILFFSLVSAVCLRIFTGARQMSQDTGNLHRAVNQAQNAAELLTYGKTRGGEAASFETSEQDPGKAGEEHFSRELLLEYPDADVSSPGEMLVYYDRYWTPCKAEGGVFCMRIDAAESDGLTLYRIDVSKLDRDERIFSLDLKLHRPVRPAF